MRDLVQTEWLEKAILKNHRVNHEMDEAEGGEEK